jgi:hypothetical protein
MAKAVGLPKATAQRPPAANGIKPHVTKTFKVSHDLALVEKVWDVIGLGSLRRPAFLAEKVLTLILAAVVLLGLSMLEPLRIVPSLADRPGAYDLAVGTPFEAAIGLVGHQDLAGRGGGEGIGNATKHEYD